MSQNNPILFLVDIFFDIYIAIILLRFLLQQFGADFYNPISQFIVKATQKPVFIARRLIPGYRGIDLSTLVLVVLLIFIKLSIIYYINGVVPTVNSIVIQGLYDLIQLIIDIFIFAIFVQAILSWINPDPYNPVASLLRSLTSPILSPIGKLIPPIGGLDLSPVVALIGLMFIKRVVLYVFQML